MGLRIYDTLTRKKKELVPLEPGVVRLYVCGPTVYAQAHVGHAMSGVVFDVIRRYLEHRGLAVRHVMNYTDVEDKILNRSRELGVNPMELAEGYIREYDEHLKTLNILPAWRTPRASGEIPAILEMIGGLVAAGAAYGVEGDVYFRVARAAGYGKLSGRKLEDMRAGARVEVDARKEDPADFALWKAAKPGEPSWPSPWGAGRPGWHIECSAMVRRHLGEQIDIHGGGNDLIFPHHENEIAQTETLTGKPFAQIWVHNGMLQFSDVKMSKSIGNVVTVEEFLKHHEGDALRMLVLNSGYRKPLTFSEGAVAQAESSLERLRSALRAEATGGGDPSFDLAHPTGSLRSGAEAALQGARQAAGAGFHAEMDDDFHTPGALGHLFELARAIQVAREAGASRTALDAAQDELRQWAGVLGLELGPRHSAGDSKIWIDLLVETRDALRAIRQFELADRIRLRLEENGVVLEDGKDGTRWRPS